MNQRQSGIDQTKKLARLLLGKNLLGLELKAYLTIVLKFAAKAKYQDLVIASDVADLEDGDWSLNVGGKDGQKFLEDCQKEFSKLGSSNTAIAKHIKAFDFEEVIGCEASEVKIV